MVLDGANLADLLAREQPEDRLFVFADMLPPARRQVRAMTAANSRLAAYRVTWTTRSRRRSSCPMQIRKLLDERTELARVRTMPSGRT